MNFARKILLAAVAVSLAVVFATPASAQSYIAVLSSAQEVPTNTSPATGLGCFTLEYDGVYYYLQYELSFSGLVAAQTAAHIHGNALSVPGVNAPPIFPFALGSPQFGTFGPLSPAQVGYLTGGTMYVNVHSSTYPGGEIRGQIVPGGPCTVPTDETTWGAVKAMYR